MPVEPGGFLPVFAFLERDPASLVKSADRYPTIEAAQSMKIQVADLSFVSSFLIGD